MGSNHPKAGANVRNSKEERSMRILVHRLSIPTLLTVAAAVLLAPKPASAIKARTHRNPIEAKEFRVDGFYISHTYVPLSSIAPAVPNRGALEALQRMYPGTVIYIDPRSARPATLTAPIPFLPGSGVGNFLTLEDLADRLGRPVREVDAGVVRDLARAFIRDYADIFNIRPEEIREIRVGRPGDTLWGIFATRQYRGIPVRKSNLSLMVNHGNIVLAGVENWGDIALDPTPAITSQEALERAFQWLGGAHPEDRLVRKPRLEIIPMDPGWNGNPGQGYAHALVWTFVFRRKGYVNTWEFIVDAHTGEILSFQDLNLYETRKIVGAIYPVSDDECCWNGGCAAPQTPMPFIDTGFPAPDDYTNLGGFYNYTSGTATTTLSGLYTNITDTCGNPSGSSATGDIDLGGANGEHDCTMPAESNTTFAARSGAAELTFINRVARGWVNYAWLDTTLTANMNLNSTCNAYWNGSTVNFYRSGGGCRNTGEIAAVFDHEWGHGLDDNDTNGAISNPGEAIADIVSTLRLRNSCAGRGFFWTLDRGCGQWTTCPSDPGPSYGYNCSGYGDCCVDCTGIRESDYAKHASGTPHTPVNFICPNCGGGGGPCGREVHCENAPMAETAWDLAARDLQGAPYNLDKDTAFELATRITYLGSGNVTDWYTCDCTAGTSDGCGATNGYMQWVAADDDNGNINDGTPHMTALYNAFNRHGIACSSPTPQDSGCSGGPTTAPTLTGTPGNNAANLSWTSVAGASQYYVYRTEGTLGCDFGKIRIATVTGTSYTDNQALNGNTYYYTVQGVGSNTSCLGPMSNCVSVVPQPCAGVVTLDRDYYSCSDTMTIHLNDGDLVGNGTQTVTVWSDTETVPETVTLTENPPNSGEFTGTFPTTSAPPVNGDGQLSVTHGDTITVRYVDASYCGTPDVNVDKTATADCQGPVISNVQAVNITDTSADITWDTNENANSRVTYGTSIPPTTNQDDLTNYVLAHSVGLSGLSSCTTYYYSVTSADIAGNSTTDTNGGGYYSFITSGRSYVLGPDDVEGGQGSWTVSGGGASQWHIDTCRSNSPTHAWKAGSTTCPGTYGNNVDTYLISPPIDLGSSGHGYHLRFYEWYETESGYDFCRPQISTDGGSTWTNLDEYSGSSGGWQAKDYDLAAYTGTVQIRFWFHTDVSVYREGWYIDDIDISRVQPCTPALKHESHTATDSCSGGGPGDANGYVEPGETVTLAVTAKNYGAQDATNVVGVLSTATPGVTILDDTATFPDIPANGSATSNPPHFTFYVDPAFTCGNAIDFTINFTADQGSWSDNFSVQVGGTFTSYLISEDFAGGIPGTWTVVNGGSCNATWVDNNPGNRNIGSPFVPPFAIADSDDAGIGCGVMDEELITPSSDASTCSTVTLDFSNQFRWYSLGGDEIGDVDVSTDGGNTWTNLLRMQGASDGYPTPNTKTIDLSAQAAGQPDVKIRFHYYNADFDWWWAVDNVNLSCSNTVCNICSGPPPSAPGEAETLMVTKSGTQLQFDWTAPGGAACNPNDYALYKGNLATLPGGNYNHDTQLTCSTGGTTTFSISLNDAKIGPTDYYLVTALNNTNEGSYGRQSDGTTERPPSANACKPQNLNSC